MQGRITRRAFLAGSALVLLAGRTGLAKKPVGVGKPPKATMTLPMLPMALPA